MINNPVFPSPESFYQGKKVLITGGLGFIGTNLAHALVRIGAHVTILDALLPLYGGNRFNLDGIQSHVRVVEGDIRNVTLVADLVRGQGVVFNLAAQVSYGDSEKMPVEDADINIRGHLNVLEACRVVNPGVRVVFTSSRLVIGRPQRTPVNEEHPANPIILYGLHKLCGERYHLLYNQVHGLGTCILRLTNPYGPRQQIKHSKYSIPGWFMRLAMEGKPITIFGDGSQLRDYIYVDDVVTALLAAGATRATDGKIYNIGSGTRRTFREMVETVVRVVGQGDIQHVPWPSDYAQTETGDYTADISRARRELGWVPEVSLEEGMRRMYDYLKRFFDRYVET